MVNFVPVERERHFGKGWRQPTNFAFAAPQATIPLLGSEFAKVAFAMPIAFVEKSGRYLPTALMSPVQGRNLFVGPGGQWLGSYTPALLRSYPFGLARTEGDKMILCIDEDSGLIVDADVDTQKFFEEDGSPSAAVKATFNFLQQVEQNRSHTDLVVAAFAETGIIGPWLLTVSVDNQPRTVNGLHRIDEAKLNTLDDQSFLKLRKAGALPLAYIQLLSMGRVGIFEHLIRLQQQLSPAPRHELSLDEIFAQAGSETVQFN